MQRSDSRKACLEAMDQLDLDMIHVAEQIGQSESVEQSERLSERLNTLDNGRIMLDQMIQRHGSDATI